MNWVISNDKSSSWLVTWEQLLQEPDCPFSLQDGADYHHEQFLSFLGIENFLMQSDREVSVMSNPWSWTDSGSFTYASLTLYSCNFEVRIPISKSLIFPITRSKWRQIRSVRVGTIPRQQTQALLRRSNSILGQENLELRLLWSNLLVLFDIFQ